MDNPTGARILKRKLSSFLETSRPPALSPTEMDSRSDNNVSAAHCGIKVSNGVLLSDCCIGYFDPANLALHVIFGDWREPCHRRQSEGYSCTWVVFDD